MFEDGILMDIRQPVNVYARYYFLEIMGFFSANVMRASPLHTSDITPHEEVYTPDCSVK